MPTKTTGRVSVLLLDEASNARRVPLSTDRDGWFYHHAVWYVDHGVNCFIFCVHP